MDQKLVSHIYRSAARQKVDAMHEQVGAMDGYDPRFEVQWSDTRFSYESSLFRYGDAM
jgi:hypothetical protein